MRSHKAILILIIIALFVFLLYTCDNAKRVEAAYAASQEQAKIWRDKEGRSNAELQVLKLGYKEFVESQANVIDSLNKLKINPKTVTKIITISNNTADTVVLTRRSFSDRWTHFNLLDSNRLAYTLRDSLALITHEKHYGFLNLKSKYVTRAVSFNPHSTLRGLTTTEIVPRNRRLSLGLYAGYGLSLSGGVVRAGWGTGVGLTFQIF